MLGKHQQVGISPTDAQIEAACRRIDLDRFLEEAIAETCIVKPDFERRLRAFLGFPPTGPVRKISTPPT